MSLANTAIFAQIIGTLLRDSNFAEGKASIYRQTYPQAFRDTIKLIDYLLILYPTPTPSAWRSRRPHALLDFLPPPPPTELSHAQRVWPGPSPASPFSTSPPEQVRFLPASRAAGHGAGLQFDIQRAEVRTKADDLVRTMVSRMASANITSNCLRQKGFDAFGNDVSAQHQTVLNAVASLREARQQLEEEDEEKGRGDEEKKGKDEEKEGEDEEKEGKEE